MKKVLFTLLGGVITSIWWLAATNSFESPDAKTGMWILACGVTVVGTVLLSVEAINDDKF